MYRLYIQILIMSIIGTLEVLMSMLFVSLCMLHTTSGYFVTNSLQHVSVALGGNIEFTCVVRDRQQDVTIVWFMQTLSQDRLFYFNASSTRNVIITTFTIGNHGMYSTQVLSESSNNTERYTLRIEGVTTDDTQFRFNCGQMTVRQQTLLASIWARIYLFLNCEFQPANIIEPIFSDTGFNISLLCEYPTTSSSPVLTWYLDETPIGGGLIDRNQMVYTLKYADIGKQFTCKAEQLPVELPPCSVTPLDISVEARLSQMVITTTIGASVTFICYNDGTALNQAHFTWYLNKTVLSDEDSTVTNVDGMSTLVIHKVPLRLNNSEVTCEINVFSVLQSNASATITVFDEYNEAYTTRMQSTPQSTAAPFPFVIVIGSAGGGLFLIVLLILLLVCCLRKKSKKGPESNPSQRNSPFKHINGTDNVKNHTSTFDNYAITNNGISDRQDNDEQTIPTYAMPNKTSKPSTIGNKDIEIPAYAIVNKSKPSLANGLDGITSENTNIPTYALVNKPKNDRPSSRLPSSPEVNDNDMSGAYDDIPSTSALYDDVPRQNDTDDEIVAYSQVNFEDKQRNVKKLNAEGLNYADLELPSSSNEPTDKHVPSSNSLYSEVKM